MDTGIRWVLVRETDVSWAVLGCYRSTPLDVYVRTQLRDTRRFPESEMHEVDNLAASGHVRMSTKVGRLCDEGIS